MSPQQCAIFEVTYQFNVIKWKYQSLSKWYPKFAGNTWQLTALDHISPSIGIFKIYLNMGLFYLEGKYLKNSRLLISLIIWYLSELNSMP